MTLACSCALAAAAAVRAQRGPRITSPVRSLSAPRPALSRSVIADVANQTGTTAVAASVPAPQTLVLNLPPGVSVTAAVARLRHRPGISYAVPTTSPTPTGRLDTRRSRPRTIAAGGSDSSGTSCRAPGWTHPGRGRTCEPTIAPEAAAPRWRSSTPASPTGTGTAFAARPISTDAVRRSLRLRGAQRFPLDREGHGTFVGGILAESTNNGIGLTGLAYGASIMPVRVLDRYGDGNAATIATRRPLCGPPPRAGDQPEPRVLSRRDRRRHPDA